jgi:hypothetical protein
MCSGGVSSSYFLYDTTDRVTNIKYLIRTWSGDKYMYQVKIAITHTFTHFITKCLYSTLQVVKLSIIYDANVDYISGSYDCVVCCGSFVPNHIKAEALRDFIRLTKKGNSLKKIKKNMVSYCHHLAFVVLNRLLWTHWVGWTRTLTVSQFVLWITTYWNLT